MHFISRHNLFNFFDILQADYEVCLPVKNNGRQFYRRYADNPGNITIGEVRTFEPLKAFFFRSRERVASGFSPDIPHSADKPYAIAGVKSCDLKAFKIYDHVFKNHDYEDPFYIRAREENLIISADCTSAIGTCFCSALGLKPYPEGNFDINLSTVQSGFVVETGSVKGVELLDKNSVLFEKAADEFVSERSEQRDWVAKKVEKNIKENDFPCQDSYSGLIEKGYDLDIWQDEAESCVECGACNVICPTCHCFLLYDEKDEQSMARLRIWDSCMIKDFARVAGGANPRPKLWMRLRNRFEKKFDFFPKTADTYACTGCGRCILACPAKIDIRKVLKRLVSNV